MTFCKIEINSYGYKQKLSRAMDRLTKTILLRMRTKHFLVLDVLGRAESMRAAATELNLTQPAVTKILQDIEGILEVKLFQRRSTGIVPTLIGRSVIEFARKTVSDVERFSGLVSNLKLGGYGSLSLGTLMAGTSTLLPTTLNALKNQRPLITINLIAATSDQLLDALSQHTIDVAIARLLEPQQNALFDFEPLLDEEIWIFARKGHELSDQNNISLAELYDESWVLQPPTSPLRQLLQSSFADVGIGALPNWIETTSIYATLQIIRQTNMIAALPRAIIENGINKDEFVRLPVTLSRELSQYGIIIRKGEEPKENAKLFINILRDTAKQELEKPNKS